jgi:hypothetical protein
MDRDLVRVVQAVSRIHFFGCGNSLELGHLKRITQPKTGWVTGGNDIYRTSDYARRRVSISFASASE